MEWFDGVTLDPAEPEKDADRFAGSAKKTDTDDLMRQPQQNKRMRGRGRKSSNLGTRVQESNGPDVKVRGSAAHIAEKYVNLARDAQVAGDRIVAENYLQHAEHYFRIVAATQSQQTQNQQGQNQQGQNQPNSGVQPQTKNVDQGGGNSVDRNRSNGTPSADNEQDVVKPDSDARPSKIDDGERPPRNRSRRKPKPEEIASPEQDESTQPVTEIEQVEGPANVVPASAIKVSRDEGMDEKTEIDSAGTEEAAESKSAESKSEESKSDSDETVEVA